MRHSSEIVESKVNYNYYSDTIRKICREGGDIACNASIVGGMIGALVGLKAIPPDMRYKVIDFDCTKTEEKGGRERPDFLSTHKHFLKNIQELLEVRPLKNFKIVENIYSQE